MFWRFSIIASSLPPASLTAGHYPQHSTLHAPRHPRRHPPGPAGAGRAQTLPRWLLPGTNRRIAKKRPGPDLDERPLLFQYVTGRTNPSDKSVLFPRPPPNRLPFSCGRRRSTPVAPGVPAGWPHGAMPVLCLLSLISRNSPKQSGVVSPELPSPLLGVSRPFPAHRMLNPWDSARRSGRW